MDKLEQQALDWIKGVLEKQVTARRMEQNGVRLFGLREADENLLEEPLRTRVKQVLERQGWRV